MPCNGGQSRGQRTAYLCGICDPVQLPATTDRTLVAGAGVSGSSPLVGSSFYRDLQVKHTELRLVTGDFPVQTNATVPQPALRGAKLAAPISGLEIFSEGILYNGTPNASCTCACSGDGDQLVLDTLIQGVIASPLPKHSAAALLPPCCANAPQSRFAAQRSIVLCELSKVAGPTHLDFRGYALEFPEIVCGKLDVDRREVLLQAVELRDG
jgi:hypothetical protein